MDRWFELEQLRRSLAMERPQGPGLSREAAMRLIGEFQEVLRRLERLRKGLARLLEEDV